MAKHLPSFQFYPADWLKDPQLQMCSFQTQGIWINLMCRMWESSTRGKLTGTAKQITQLVGCSVKEFSEFLNENKTNKFADISERNGIVTVKNRRMYKEEQARQESNGRVKRHRVTKKKRESNENVTPYSSSSSSTSVTDSVTNDVSKIINWYRSFASVPHPLNQETGKADKERLAQLIAKHGCDVLTATGAEILIKRRKNNTTDPTTINYLLKCWENIDENKQVITTQQLKKELSELTLDRNGVEVMVEDFPEYAARLEEIDSEIARIEAVLNGSS